MGKRAKKERERRRLAAPLPALPPPPLPGSSSVRFADWLGDNGMILVLFETPSGFALLYYDGVKLFRPKALENIWTDFINRSTAEWAIYPKDFQVFEDKASAINSNGVCSKLANMIKRSLRHGQRLAVGKQEYKDIIEASLKIHCLFDEAVLEVMWGLKNLIKVLVPNEGLQLTNEDRLQISQGMKSVLDRYRLEIEANLVNSDIIVVAATLHECDRFEDHRAKFLQYGSEKVEMVSGFDSKNWHRLKLATALKLICYPEGENVIGDSEEMLSKTEADKLVADARAHRYDYYLHKGACLKIYEDIVWVYGVRSRALTRLESMVKEAKADSEIYKSLKLKQLSIVKEEDQDLNLHTWLMVKGTKENLKVNQVCSRQME